jgi:hypothetical protein
MAVHPAAPRQLKLFEKAEPGETAEVDVLQLVDEHIAMLDLLQP